MPRGGISKRSALPIPGGLPPTGAAGGDLAGTFPNPTVDGLQGSAVSATPPNVGDLLRWSGAAWTPFPSTTAETVNTIVQRDAAAAVFATAFKTAGAGQVTAAATLIVQSGAGNIMVIDSGSTLYFEIASVIKASFDTAGQFHAGADADTTNVNLRVNGLTTAAPGAAGGGAVLPVTPEGYLEVNINGTVRKIPFYPV